MSFYNFLLDVILPAIVGSGTAFLLVWFLGERLIRHRLSKDLESYKSELLEKTNVLKTQLAIFSHEQNVAISRVDAQRAKAINDVYSCMRKIINPVTRINSGSPIRDGKSMQSLEYYFSNSEEAHAACGTMVNTMADLAI